MTDLDQKVREIRALAEASLNLTPGSWDWCDANEAFDKATTPDTLTAILDEYDRRGAALVEAEGALRRQTDNMAFILNRVDLHGFQEKFERELAEDRAALTTKGEADD